MQSCEFHIVDGVEVAADEAGQRPRPDGKVTLVLTRSAAVGRAANVTVTRLDCGPVEFVSSFSVACQVIMANRASQVVVLETSSTALDKFEVGVLQRLAEGIPLVCLRVPEWRATQAAAQVSYAGRNTAAELSDTEIQVGRLRLRRHARHFCVDDLHVPVTSTESELLWMLASKGVATEALLRRAFRNPEALTTGSVVRQYVHRLRRKLELSGGAASIVSVRGGYGLVPLSGGAPGEPHCDPGQPGEQVTTAA